MRMKNVVTSQGKNQKTRRWAIPVINSEYYWRSFPLGICKCDGPNWNGTLCDHCADEYHGPQCQLGGPTTPVPETTTAIQTTQTDSSTSTTIVLTNPATSPTTPSSSTAPSTSSSSSSSTTSAPLIVKPNCESHIVLLWISTIYYIFMYCVLSKGFLRMNYCRRSKSHLLNSLPVLHTLNTILLITAKLTVEVILDEVWKEEYKSLDNHTTKDFIQRVKPVVSITRLL